MTEESETQDFSGSSRLPDPVQQALNPSLSMQNPSPLLFQASYSGISPTILDSKGVPSSACALVRVNVCACMCVPVCMGGVQGRANGVLFLPSRAKFSCFLKYGDKLYIARVSVTPYYSILNIWCINKVFLEPKEIAFFFFLKYLSYMLYLCVYSYV